MKKVFMKNLMVSILSAVFLANTCTLISSAQADKKSSNYGFTVDLNDWYVNWSTVVTKKNLYAPKSSAPDSIIAKIECRAGVARDKSNSKLQQIMVRESVSPQTVKIGNDYCHALMDDSEISLIHNSGMVSVIDVAPKGVMPSTTNETSISIGSKSAGCSLSSSISWMNNALDIYGRTYINDGLFSIAKVTYDYKPIRTIFWTNDGEKSINKWLHKNTHNNIAIFSIEANKTDINAFSIKYATKIRCAWSATQEYDGRGQNMETEFVEWPEHQVAYTRAGF